MPTTPTPLGDHRAACRDNPQPFYGDTEQQRAAQTVCATCPLVAACGSLAIESDERFGVWGGLTPTDRLRLTTRDLSWVDDEGRVRLPCGTDNALGQHGRYGETCETCAAARTDRIEAGRRERLAAAHATAEGGSRRGYELHRMLGEYPCPACLAQASSVAMAAKRRARDARQSVQPVLSVAS